LDQKQCRSTWSRNHDTAKRTAKERDLTPFAADDRLTIDPAAWCSLESRFGKLFFQMAGHPQTVDSTRTRGCDKWG